MKNKYLYKTVYRWMYDDRSLNNGKGYFEFCDNIVASDVKEVIAYLEETMKPSSSKRLEVLEMSQIAVIDHVL